MQGTEHGWLGAVLLMAFFVAGILRGATNHPGRMMHTAHLLIVLAWITYVAGAVSTVAAEDISLNLLVGLAISTFVTGFGWMLGSAARSDAEEVEDSAARNGFP